MTDETRNEIIDRIKEYNPCENCEYAWYSPGGTTPENPNPPEYCECDYMYDTERLEDIIADNYDLTDDDWQEVKLLIAEYKG